MEQQPAANLVLEVYPHQVSGKEPKLLSPDATRLLKGFNQNEEHFYLAVQHPQAPHALQRLRPFLPTYYHKERLSTAPNLVISNHHETEWLSHLAARYKTRNEANEFIVLENLTYSYKRPNIFDIKIGGRNVEGKTHKITKSVSQFCLKLNGCQITDEQGQTTLLTKYFLGKVTELKAMEEFFTLFLSSGSSIVKPALNGIICKLEGLLLVFQQLKGYRFISSSVCMFYDRQEPQKNDVRLLDFGRVIKQDEEFVDRQSIVGMKTIVQMLKNIEADCQSYESRISQIRNRIKQQQVAHIPENKRAKIEPISLL